MSDVPAPRGGLPGWARVAGVMFGVGWGANQFASLLLAYKLHAGVTQSTADALFGVYAVGLIPALLLIGPISDLRGRRRVVLGAAVVSLLASVALIAGRRELGLLFLGRFLAGACSGAAFAAGTAWVKELSEAPYDLGAGAGAGAQRAAIGLSAGFGFGPLVAGLLAQWAPAPLVVAYVPHLIVISVAFMVARGAPETVMRRSGRFSPAGLLRVPSAAHLRFRRVIAPCAPWVFAAPSVAFAVMPGLVAGRTGSFQVGFASLMAAVTLSAGVAVQPVARRLDRRDTGRGLVGGLGAIAAGLLVGALAADRESWPLVIATDALLGAGYGLCLVSGLREIQAIATRADLGSLTAIFYALTYVGFAAPLIIAELEHILAAPLVLLLAAGLAALTIAEMVRMARHHVLD